MASAGEKSLAVGHISGFQIDPKIFRKDFNCPKGKEFIWDLFCDFFPYKSQKLAAPLGDAFLIKIKDFNQEIA